MALLTADVALSLLSWGPSVQW